MSNLVGKNILIVDEVDDTRTTLEYAVRELEKDVETARQKLGREGDKTRFSIFVLHVSENHGSHRAQEEAEAQNRLGKTRLILSIRTKTSRRRAIYRRTWWTRADTLRHRQYRTYGYVIHGRQRM